MAEAANARHSLYDLVDGQSRDKTVAEVTLDGDTLYLAYGAKGKEALVPLSPTRFSWSGAIMEFVSRGSGPELLIHYAESTEVGPRRK